MTWVEHVLLVMYSRKETQKIMDDIDRRYAQLLVSTFGQSVVVSIALVPPFTGLRNFPQGRGYKQWTGDDSKALMKVP